MRWAIAILALLSVGCAATPPEPSGTTARIKRAAATSSRTLLIARR